MVEYEDNFVIAVGILALSKFQEPDEVSTLHDHARLGVLTTRTLEHRRVLFRE